MQSEILQFINFYISTIVLCVLVCVFTWKLWRERPSNSPPGTNGFPLLGVITSLRAFPERVLKKYTDQYGPLCMVKFGLLDIVLISNYEVAYEAFAKHDCFNDRPDTIPIISGNGILLVNRNDFHKEQRRFGLNTLRLFGMGRRSLEPRLLEVTSELCDKVKQHCEATGTSEPFDISRYIYEAVSSVISFIIFNHDVAKENEKLHGLLMRLTESDKDHVLASIMMFVPFLRYLPGFSKIWKKSGIFRDDVHEQIWPEVEEHDKTRDPKNPRDFIDCFLNQVDKAEKCEGNSDAVSPKMSVSDEDYDDDDDDQVENFDFSKDWKPLSSFHKEQLVSMVRDLFLAGTDTSSTTILWIILHLCKYPEVQRKMQKEIDEVLGHNGVPRMSMKEKFPYVQAVIQEVSRLRPTVPLSVPHLASRDATLLGYRIPKGAIILTNIWAIHHDKTKWREPEKFSPERHLDSDGKFIKNQNWMLFNVGERSCLGQQLAKMELFITTISLFHRFKFSLPPNQQAEMDGENVVALRPLHFDLIAAIR